MSSKQLKHNKKIEGGFLGLLAGLAARALPLVAKTILPALGVGALSGLASSGVQKAMGSGLHLKKGGCVCQVETDGSGLYLKPYKGQRLKGCGYGLYLKQGGKLYDGKGLLLGANSPFANIPKEVKQLQLGFGFMMSEVVVLVGLANSLKYKWCSLQNEINLEDARDIVVTLTNNSNEIVDILEHEPLCRVCYKKL